MSKCHQLYIILVLFCLSFYSIPTNVVADTFGPPPDGGPPNMLSVVQQVATEHPDWLENLYNSNDNPNGTWDFLDEVVRRLRTQSTKWGYNGKRGDLKNPSSDVISYYYGSGEAPTSGTMQMYEVYLIDIATFGQSVHWNEVTDYTGCVLGAYLYPRTGGNLSLPSDKPALVENCDSDEGGAPFPVQPIYTPPESPTNLGQLIQQIFGWSLGILGISVFVMFFYSGFLWLTAAGNTSKIGEAKTHMTNAVFGAILLLSSYLILYTINPDFVRNTVSLPGLKQTTPTTTITNPDITDSDATCNSGFAKYGNKKAGEVCRLNIIIPFSGIPPETDCAGPDLACKNMKCRISGTSCNTNGDCPLNPLNSRGVPSGATDKDICTGVCKRTCETNPANIPGVLQ